MLFWFKEFENKIVISCGISKYLLPSLSLTGNLKSFPGYIDLESEGKKAP